MRKIVIRLSTVFVLMLAILSGASLFWVSQQVQQLEREQRVMHQQVSSEQEGIRVLSAEWDYLNRPERLEYLSSRYLKTMELVEPENLLNDANLVPEKQALEEEEEGRIISVVHPVSKPEITKRPTVVRDIPQEPIEDSVSKKTDDFKSILDQIVAGDHE
ncbi:MAG: hypothetical protein KDJ26_04490 [Alphaproteobacteria bacterium]|nr:hypothetical protein [Alphaproteobacteria bacterium]MCB9984307.1 hypothetical protein [Micavibrio sp.]